MKPTALNSALTSLFCLISLLSFSQQYEWDQYGIGFTVAQDFVIQENNERAFSATSNDGEISISINPWKDSSITEDNMADTVLMLAKQITNDNNRDIAGNYLEIDDFSGYYIITASEDDFDFIAIVLLIDSESSTNLAIAIGFNDGNSDEVESIVEGFYAFD